MTNFLEQNSVIAVVGVSLDSTKYGHKVFFDLLSKGYNVYAVHPVGGLVSKQTRYLNLNILPQKPDLVVIVTPPQETEKIVKECQKLNIKKIWFQPGSESKEAIDFCKKNNIFYLVNTCIIIDSIKNNSDNI
jgi:predicted CoA-binding protein